MQARIVSTAAEDPVSAFLSALQATGVRVRLSEGLLLSLNASPELTTQVEHAVDALRARFPTIALTLQHYQ
ncbi:MAG: hypothetical protein NZM28_05325, partial [Fimbriimonadales bacterium]|nr:hypothetical protein [Fimbriimonadales bacterium]